MATVDTATAQTAQSTRGAFGAAFAVAFRVADAVFFCGSLVAVPSMVVMALNAIPQRLRKHISIS